MAGQGRSAVAGRRSGVPGRTGEEHAVGGQHQGLRADHP